MAKPSDELRRQADRARAMAGAMSRHDMRRAALDLAQGWDREADEADAAANAPPKARPKKPSSD